MHVCLHKHTSAFTRTLHKTFRFYYLPNFLTFIISFWCPVCMSHQTSYSFIKSVFLVHDLLIPDGAIKSANQPVRDPFNFRQTRCIVLSMRFSLLKFSIIVLSKTARSSFFPLMAMEKRKEKQKEFGKWFRDCRILGSLSFHS